jgi:hypothetical protein
MTGLAGMRAGKQRQEQKKKQVLRCTQDDNIFLRNAGAGESDWSGAGRELRLAG